MSTNPSRRADRGGSISLDEFILLNEEIRSLIRAGVPLDLGLRGTASRVGGRLSEIADRLARRLEGGASLEDALAAEGDLVPAVYRSLLAAGFRSGRIEEVLGSVSRFAASMRDLSAEIRRMLIYPGAVVVIAYTLFVGLNVYVTPRLMTTYELSRLQTSWWIRVIEMLQATVGWWGPGIPIAAATILLAEWLWSCSTSASARGGGPAAIQPGLLRLIPGFRGVVGNARLARFAHLLSVLTEFEVPFPEALRLSAAGTGDARLILLVERAAKSAEAGQPPDRAIPEGRALPPLLRWLLLLSLAQGTLPSTMRHAADVYEQRALTRAEWIQRLLPSVLVIVLGGGMALLYALSLFLPLQSVWRSLST
ncbi:MAG: hypothetical protein DWQ34_08480 [Planctomycetota bacterium]|nr:MAG: hypothetical protein DWQ34_08480 [Planctomycetota bacterium]